MMGSTDRNGGAAFPSRPRIARWGLALALAASCLSPAWAAPPPENHPAPPFEITALDGTVFSSDNTRGKVVLLTFWASWCLPCREEMPALEKFYRQHRDEGLEVVAVNIEEGSDESGIRKLTRPYAFPVASMGANRIGNYGSISFVPLSFVIDRKGILRKSAWTGNKPMNAANLGKYVQPLLREH